jgi:hypothetical protein
VSRGKNTQPGMGVSGLQAGWPIMEPGPEVSPSLHLAVMCDDHHDALVSCQRLVCPLCGISVVFRRKSPPPGQLVNRQQTNIIPHSLAAERPRRRCWLTSSCPDPLPDLL